MSSQPILVLVPDLMMRQRIVGGLQALGYAAAGIAKPARLAEALEAGAPRAVLVEIDGMDLDGPGVVTALAGDPRRADAPIVGFCSHMRTELMDAVRAAGADLVVARGELVRKLDRVMADTVGPPGAPAADPTLRKERP